MIKEEEQQVINKEVIKLKDDINKEMSPKNYKDTLLRMIYCEMLGAEVSFGYVFAINNTQHPDILVKRTAYLAVSLFLDEDSELNLLSTHSIRKGLESTNYLEVCAALTTLCSLVNAGTIPAFYPVVEKLIQHPKYMVRQKAVMAMHRMWHKNHSAVDIQRVLRASLCDQKPSVMAAALCCFQEVLRTTLDETKKKTSSLIGSPEEEAQTQFAKANTNLVPAFVQILWQVIEHRLPKSFDYHGVPAPWLQVHLLDILGLLGKDNKAASDQIYDVIIGTMKAAASIPSIASSAVIYECVKTSTKLYPNPSLLKLAGTVIDRFMSSKDNNMRSLGIKALSLIVRRYPSAITQSHHMALIESLESKDETIRRDTLDLLYRMTNAKNVTAIVQKMMDQLKSSTDEYLKKALVTRILQVSERYTPDPKWYLNTLFEVFQLAGSVINTEVAHHFTRMVSEDDSDEETGFKKSAAVILTNQLHKTVIENKVQTLTDVLVQCMAWVIGEYAPLAVSDKNGVESALLDLCDLFQHHQSRPETKLWVITAIGKLIARLGYCPSTALTIIDEAKESPYIDVQQAAYEIAALAKFPQLLALAMPEDASWEEVEVDTSLSFLNTFTASKNTSRRYMPPNQRRAQEIKRAQAATTPTLNFQYPTPAAAAKQAISSNTLLSASSQKGNSLGSESGNKKSLWSADGYAGDTLSSKQPEPEEPTSNLGDLLSGLAISKEKNEVPKASVPEQSPASLVSDISASLHEPQRKEQLRSRETKYDHQKRVEEQKNEEQKNALAASLFAGLDDSQSTGIVGIGKRTKKTQKPAATEISLFSGLSIASSTSPSTPQPAQPKPKPADDLLSDLFGTPSSPSPSVQPATQSNTNSLMDLFNTPSPSQPVSTSSQSIEQMLGISASTTNFSKMLRPGDLSFDAMTCSTAISTNIFTKISPRTKIVPIFKGSNFTINSAVAPNGTSTLATVFITNTGSAPLSNIQLAFSAMPSIGIQNATADMGVQLSQMTAKIDLIKPQEAAAIIFTVKFLAYAPNYGIVVRGNVGAIALPDVVAPLSIADAIRPLNFTTQQFGALWVRFTSEKRLKIATLSSLNDTVKRITDMLNLHAVQVIGNECILCGSVENNANVPQMLCFAHCKYDNNPNVGTILTIRTNDRNFTDSLAQNCMEIA